jgi:hypothetical protein
MGYMGSPKSKEKEAGCSSFSTHKKYILKVVCEAEEHFNAVRLLL